MNNPNPPSSFRQKCLDSFRSQISGGTVERGLCVHRRKKRDRKWSKSDEYIVETSICSLKPKPGKKPEPSSPKIARRCTECGKQFWSWKALFGHMRCHPERQWRGIKPPSNLRQPVLPENPAPCFEGKFTEEDHEVATCLVILANGLTKMSTPSAMIDTGLPKFGDSPKESSVVGDIDSGASLLDSSGRFKCACCQRIFGSRQALGGHRATHKNVKGCFAAAQRNDGEDDYHNGDCRSDEGREGVVKETEEKKMVMVLGHKCSICLRVFSSGQALGGHMRCHWEKGDEPPTPPPPPQGMNLDLNLPASIDNDGDSSSSIISPSDLAWDLRLGI